MYFSEEVWVDETEGEWVDVEIEIDVEDVHYMMRQEEEDEMRNLLGLPFRIRTVEDQLKMELLQELFEKKSLKEIEEIVNNK